MPCNTQFDVKNSKGTLNKLLHVTFRFGPTEHLKIRDTSFVMFTEITTFCSFEPF